MLILAIDSAAGACSTCIWQDGKILAIKEERMERGQDQRLMPMVLEVLQKANIEFANLDRIAVARGPGSFTGLRIGLAAARGIAFAASKPVIGINRFEIYREQNKTSGKNLFVVIGSKRKELYCQFFPLAGSASDPMMLNEDEIKEFLQDKKDVLTVGDRNNTPEKEAITCAALAAKADINDPAYLPRPLYLRAPDVTMTTRPAPVIEACRD